MLDILSKARISIQSQKFSFKIYLSLYIYLSFNFSAADENITEKGKRHI
jgi:hypothetical protein